MTAISLVFENHYFAYRMIKTLAFIYPFIGWNNPMHI